MIYDKHGHIVAEGVDLRTQLDFPPGRNARHNHTAVRPVSVNTVAGGVCLGMWLFLLTSLPVAFCIWLVLMFLSHG